MKTDRKNKPSFSCHVCYHVFIMLPCQLPYHVCYHVFIMLLQLPCQLPGCLSCLFRTIARQRRQTRRRGRRSPERGLDLWPDRRDPFARAQLAHEVDHPAKRRQELQQERLCPSLIDQSKGGGSLLDCRERVGDEQQRHERLPSHYQGQYCGKGLALVYSLVAGCSDRTPYLRTSSASNANEVASLNAYGMFCPNAMLT